MDLTQNQWIELQSALESAFSNKSSFYELGPRLRMPLGGRGLDLITDGAIGERIRQLIEAAESGGWTLSLVDAAFALRPGNSRLHSFVAKYRRSVQSDIAGAALERIVVSGQRFKDPKPWREELAAMERRVCRMERNGAPVATGVLVAADLVLTNAHVIANGPVDALSARFDAHLDPHGQGSVSRVLPDGLVQHSPPSSTDLAFPKSTEATTQELDFALLRLRDHPGLELLPASGTTRGIVPINSATRPCRAGEILFLLQHPMTHGEESPRLRLSFDVCIGSNAAGTRVTYRANTNSGSSGSPCFDQDWHFVALHHAGDPRMKQNAEFNEGIPLGVIVAALSEPVRRELGLDTSAAR